MRTIRVTMSSIEYAPIIAFYNANKTHWEPKLEELNRAEGGFQVRVDGLENERCDANEKIRQLRWHRRRLVQHQGWPTFEDWEVGLLYRAFVSVYGDSQIILEDDTIHDSEHVFK